MNRIETHNPYMDLVTNIKEKDEMEEKWPKVNWCIGKEEIEYCKNDVEVTAKLFTNYSLCEIHLENLIEKVIFNEPATIVIWKDGTKTVVKVQEGEEFDPYIGLAMCISKKAMGNQGNYFNVFKKWCEPYVEENRDDESDFIDFMTFANAVEALFGPKKEEKHYCRDCKYCDKRIEYNFWDLSTIENYKCGKYIKQISVHEEACDAYE